MCVCVCVCVRVCVCGETVDFSKTENMKKKKVEKHRRKSCYTKTQRI